MLGVEKAEYRVFRDFIVSSAEVLARLKVDCLPALIEAFLGGLRSLSGIDRACAVEVVLRLRQPSAKECLDVLLAEGLIDKERFIDLVENGNYSEYDFLDGAVEGKHHLEGYLFPETYFLPEGATEEDFIKVMLDHFGEIWAKYSDRAAELGLPTNEVITMASLIEREAALPEERALVSSVIYNRLEVGMPLQMDASLDFILELMGENHQYITFDDMAIDSPYNTYQIEGLPPGPIACPGERCIAAALYPADTNYLYYVKTTDQGWAMTFCETYEEFLVAKEAWEETIVEGEND